MISERDLRLAKAIVDPYIGQDIIATAVLGTKLGSMLNENALGCHRFSAIRHAVCRSIRMAGRFLCGAHARL